MFIPGETTLHYSLPDLAQQLNAGIKLAGFQRGAFWKDEQIELLWDSILCGFPIGALMFAPAHDEKMGNMAVRDFQGGRSGENTHNQPASAEVEFIVVDGQQRLDAISLGMLDGIENARLWLDLAAPAAEGSRYVFFACTKENPWGRNATTAQKRDVLNRLGYDKDNPIDPELSQTYPLQAQVPVPFRELCKAIEKHGASTQNVMHEMSRWVTGKESALRPDFLQVLQAIQATIFEKRYRIPVITVRGLEKAQIGKIFERLNRGGTPPNEAELFFSALKLRWPEVHNLVGKIYNDRDTGKFLNPLQIVQVAVRTIKKDELGLALKKFDGFMSEHGQALENLLQLGNETQPKSRLHQYLLWAKQALMFNGSPSDPGLPAPLLLQIRPRVWQTLVYWLSHHPAPVAPANRLEMLRYALFDYFFVDPRAGANGLSNAPFGRINADGQGFLLEKSDTFPGEDIYQALLPVISGQKYLVELLSPDEFAQRSGQQKALWGLLYQEHGLFYWIQREYFHAWFGKYEKDVYWIRKEKPYDVDHILPSSYLRFPGPVPLGKYCHPDMRERYIRYSVVDNAGNLRCWPNGVNRGNRDANLDKKFLLGDPSHPIADNELKTYGLASVGDVRRASFIPEESLADWEIAANLGKSRHDWTNIERFDAFRRAVAARRISMYTSLYQSLDWNQWQQKFEEQ